MSASAGWDAGRIRPRRVLAIGIPIGLALGVALGISFPVFSVLTAPDYSDPPMGNRALLEPVVPTTFSGSEVTITDSLRAHDHSVWIDERDTGLVVDQTDLECHGGRAHIVWHVGNLEPQVIDRGIHLSARLDGEVVGSVLRGTRVDSWGDDPIEIHAVADCDVGPHVLDLIVRSVHGRWGFPYVVNENEPSSPDLRVNRGFVVTEIWD